MMKLPIWSYKTVYPRLSIVKNNKNKKMKIESLLICGNIAYTNKKSKRGNEKCAEFAKLGARTDIKASGKMGVRVG
jgi:hypothetical protein